MSATSLPATTIDIRRSDTLKKSFAANVLPRIFLIIMSIFFLLPLYWMLTIALKGPEELRAYPPTLIVQNPQWQNFVRATQEIDFWRYAGNTTLITVICVFGAVLANPFIAYGFSRIQWPGRDKLFFVLLASMFMPGPALLVAMFDIWTNIRNFFRPVLPSIVIDFMPLTLGAFLGSGFWIFMLRQFMMQIPKDLSEAATIDGANEFRIFSEIILPQTIPAIGVIGIFAFMDAWNDFMGPLIYLIKPERYTLALGLTFFQDTASRQVFTNLMMAASAITIIPVVLMFLLFQKAFIGGLTIGSVKG